MAFAAARAGRRALILTALCRADQQAGGAPAHLRLLRRGPARRRRAGAQPGPVPGASGRGSDRPQGARHERTVLALARQVRANLVVLDGFRGVRAAATDPQAARALPLRGGDRAERAGRDHLITSEADAARPGALPRGARPRTCCWGCTTAWTACGQRRGLGGGQGARRGAAGAACTAWCSARDGRRGLPAPGGARRRARRRGVGGGRARRRRTTRASFGLPELRRAAGRRPHARRRQRCCSAAWAPARPCWACTSPWPACGGRAGRLPGLPRDAPSSCSSRPTPSPWARTLRAALAPGGGLTLLRLDRRSSWTPTSWPTGCWRRWTRTGARRLVVDSMPSWSAPRRVAAARSA